MKSCTYIFVFGAVLLGLVVLILPEISKGQHPSKHDPALPGDSRKIGETDISAESTGRLRMAIAPTPRDFPDHGPRQVHEMVDRTAALCSAAVLIYQWSDENLVSTASAMIRFLGHKNLTTVVGLSPTTLDQGRKELDIPASLRSQVSGRATFDSQVLQQDYIKTAEALARLNPPYLCLATEINFLALQRMDEYLKFAKLYKQAYHAVKRISPDTKVFVSFQYEFIRILDNLEPDQVEEHRKVIDIFRPELDVLAIASYPADYYERPQDLPANYFRHIKRYAKPDEEILVMEIGWPSGSPGSLEEQQAFIQYLPALMSEINPTLTGWSLLHDVQLAQFGDNLATTGLLDRNGAPKPSLEAMQNISAK